MSIENPTNKVRRKPGKALPKLGGGGPLPDYSGINPGDTERNRLHGFSEVDEELNYLKRLSLRASLAGSSYQSFVPDLSEKEIVVADYLTKLNKLNRDPSKRMVMENLFHRFNSRSCFNISQELASLKLSRQSVQELEALVDDGVEAMVSKATGSDSASAERAKAREQFATNARFDAGAMNIDG